MPGRTRGPDVRGIAPHAAELEFYLRGCSRTAVRSSWDGQTETADEMDYPAPSAAVGVPLAATAHRRRRTRTHDEDGLQATPKAANGGARRDPPAAHCCIRMRRRHATPKPSPDHSCGATHITAHCARAFVGACELDLSLVPSMTKESDSPALAARAAGARRGAAQGAAIP